MKNSIHMLASVDGGQMNSFIVTTEGGAVIVIDGGENNCKKCSDKVHPVLFPRPHGTSLRPNSQAR